MKKKFVIILPLWGKKYIEVFFKHSYQSLLFRGNLKFLTNNADVKIIYCTNKIEKKKIYEQSNDIDKKIISFCFIDEILRKHLKKHQLHLAYLKAFQYEKRDHTKINFILLTADDFFASDNLKYLFKIVKYKSDLNLILENKILVNYQLFKMKIKKFLIKKNITKKELVKLSFLTMDDFSYFSNPYLKKFNYAAYNLLFKVDRNNKLMRGYLLHPLLIRPKKQITKMKSFFDYYLQPEYVKSFKNIFIIKNSNDFVRVGIANQNIYKNIVYKFEIQKYANRLSKWVTTYHKKYVFFDTLFTVKKPNKKKIILVRKRSYDLVKKIDLILKNNSKSHKNHPYWISKNPTTTSIILANIKKFVIYPLLRFF